MAEQALDQAEIARQYETERWLPVPGWEGIYEASDMGRIKRVLCRQGEYPRISAGSPQKSGHMRFSLLRRQKKWLTHVHRIVMLTFVGPCPDGMEVCHNNGNPADNRLSNLRYDTQAGNMADRVLHGTAGFGEKAPNRKLTTSQVVEILRDKRSQRSIGAEYGVSGVAVHCIKAGKTWRHIPRD